MKIDAILLDTLNKSDFVRFQPEIMPIHPSEITPQE
jgi:hypothetical protein